MANEPRADRQQIEIEAMMERMLQDLCTTRQAAEILGVKDSQVLHLIKAKRIAAIRLGHRYWVIHKPSLTKYLKSKSRRGRPPSRPRE